MGMVGPSKPGPASGNPVGGESAAAAGCEVRPASPAGGIDLARGSVARL